MRRIRFAVYLLIVPLFSGCAYHTTLRRAIDLPWPTAVDSRTVQSAASKKFPPGTRRDELLWKLRGAETPAEQQRKAVASALGNTWTVYERGPLIGPAWIQSFGPYVIMGPVIHWWKVEVASDDWPSLIYWYCRMQMYIDFWFDGEELRHIDAERAGICP